MCLYALFTGLYCLTTQWESCVSSSSPYERVSLLLIIRNRQNVLSPLKIKLLLTELKRWRSFNILLFCYANFWEDWVCVLKLITDTFSVYDFKKKSQSLCPWLSFLLVTTVLLWCQICNLIFPMVSNGRQRPARSWNNRSFSWALAAWCCLFLFFLVSHCSSPNTNGSCWAHWCFPFLVLFLFYLKGTCPNLNHKLTLVWRHPADNFCVQGQI